MSNCLVVTKSGDTAVSLSDVFILLRYLQAFYRYLQLFLRYQSQPLEQLPLSEEDDEEELDDELSEPPQPQLGLEELLLRLLLSLYEGLHTGSLRE